MSRPPVASVFHTNSIHQRLTANGQGLTTNGNWQLVLNGN